MFFLYSPPDTFNGFEVQAQTCQESSGGVCLPNGEGASCSKTGSGTCPQYKFCCVEFVGVGGGPTAGCPFDSINTAFGCIPVGTSQGLVITSLRIAMGIAGGISFVLIVYAGMMIMTSSGDPGKLRSGKELLTAAIAGLLFLILGVYFFNIIGTDILGIFS